MSTPHDHYRNTALRLREVEEESNLFSASAVSNSPAIATFSGKTGAMIEERPAWPGPGAIEWASPAGRQGNFSFNKILDPDCLLELMAHGPYSKLQVDVTIKISPNERGSLGGRGRPATQRGCKSRRVNMPKSCFLLLLSGEVDDDKTRVRRRVVCVLELQSCFQYNALQSGVQESLWRSKAMSECKHQKTSMTGARAEVSIECLRWSFFLDDLDPLELLDKSEAKLISRLKSGFLNPPPPPLVPEW
ncbi:hypothetical protein BS17DRAFT_770865, partial [Gyrodon lividus]